MKIPETYDEWLKAHFKPGGGYEKLVQAGLKRAQNASNLLLEGQGETEQRESDT